MDDIYFIKLYLIGWQWLLLLIFFLLYNFMIIQLSPIFKKNINKIIDKILKKDTQIGFK